MKKLFVLILMFYNVSGYSQDLDKLMEKANEKAGNKKFTEAISDYNLILSKDPSFSFALVMKGLCFASIKQTDSACVCFVDGIEMGSRNSKNYFPKYCKEYKPNLNTEIFKVGKFKYLTDNSDTTAYIIRDNNLQTEYFENSSLYSKFEIKWKSNIEFELKFIETNDSKLSFLTKGDIMLVKILKVNDDNYVYMSELFGNILYGIHEKQK